MTHESAVPTVPLTRPAVRIATYVIVGSAAQALTATRRVVGRTGALLIDLAERGAAEQEEVRRRAASARTGLVRALAVNSVMNRVVDAQLERTVRPLVSSVLDDVLKLLDDEPERIGALISSQRDSITDDLVNRVRSGAVAGDATVDRMMARLLRRRTMQPQPVPQPASVSTPP